MEALVLFADILGFKNIVKNTDLQVLLDRMAKWEALLKTKCEELHLDKIKLLSDSLVVSCSPKKDEFESLIQFSKILLESSVKLFLPVRGGISYGEYDFQMLSLGKAFVEAYEVQSDQQWIGISCDESLPVELMTDCWDLNHLVCYPPPFKKKKVTVLPVVLWDIPGYEILIGSLTQGGQLKKWEEIGWDLLYKLNNTLEFKQYVNFLKHFNESPEFWHSRFPAQIIDAYFNDLIVAVKHKDFCPLFQSDIQGRLKGKFEVAAQHDHDMTFD